MFKYLIGLFLIANFVFVNSVELKEKKLKDGPLCPVCLEVVNATQNALKNNKTEAEIVKTLEKLCLGLGPLLIPCFKFVKAEAPTIISLIAEYDNATLICQLIGLCDKNSVFVNSKQLEAIKVQKLKPKVGGPMCSVCLNLINETKTLLSNNESEIQILHKLEVFCIPLGGLALPCYLFIKNYGPKIIDDIKKNTEDPEAICKQFGVCVVESSLPVLEKAKNIKDVAKGELCPICKTVLNTTQSFLADNKTEKFITHAIEFGVCLALGPLLIPCWNLVKEYLPKIISDLAQGIDPSIICQSIGLCDTQINNKITSLYQIIRKKNI